MRDFLHSGVDRGTSPRAPWSPRGKETEISIGERWSIWNLWRRKCYTESKLQNSAETPSIWGWVVSSAYVCNPENWPKNLLGVFCLSTLSSQRMWEFPDPTSLRGKLLPHAHAFHKDPRVQLSWHADLVKDYWNPSWTKTKVSLKIVCWQSAGPRITPAPS